MIGKNNHLCPKRKTAACAQASGLQPARTHIRNIYGKLDVHGRKKAVQLAEDMGLV